jgi:hypothetical protein
MTLSSDTILMLRTVVGNDIYSIPHGGWQFREPQLNWELPNPRAENIMRAADRLSAVRRQNPRFNLSTDLDDCAQEIIRFWLFAHKRKVPDAVPKKAEAAKAPPSRSGSAAAAVADAKRMVAGAGALLEWLGKETPVEQAEAERRAAICAACPLNLPGNFWERLIGDIADTARHWMRLKSSMALRTAKDSQLHLCDACGCPLTTKVWVHLDHIRKHTDPEVFKELHEKCWITET